MVLVFASCGHDSIDFKETIGGYNIPIIDYDSCTNCGLCFDVCSGDHFGKTLTNNIPENHFVGNIISTHVGKATDKRIFDNSQSGGITTSILANLLNSNEIEPNRSSFFALPQHAERTVGGIHLTQEVGLGEGAGLADFVSVDGDCSGLDILLGLAFGRAQAKVHQELRKVGQGDRTDSRAPGRTPGRRPGCRGPGFSGRPCQRAHRWRPKPFSARPRHAP